MAVPKRMAKPRAKEPVDVLPEHYLALFKKHVTAPALELALDGSGLFQRAKINQKVGSTSEHKRKL